MTDSLCTVGPSFPLPSSVYLLHAPQRRFTMGSFLESVGVGREGGNCLCSGACGTRQMMIRLLRLTAAARPNKPLRCCRHACVRPSVRSLPIPSHLSSVRFRSGRNNNVLTPTNPSEVGTRPPQRGLHSFPAAVPAARAVCEYERASEDGWMDNGAVSNCLEGGGGKVVGKADGREMITPRLSDCVSVCGGRR